MLFYLLLIFFVLLMFLLMKLSVEQNNNVKRRILYTLEIVVVVIFVFRYDVGWDYKNYYYIVADNVPSERCEPLSALFIAVAQYFKSPQLLFILYGVLTYVLFFKSINRNSCNVEFSLLIYLCLFIFDSLGLIRQSLAVAIVFSGYKYVCEMKFLKFLILVFVAMGFHYSAIVAFLIYPLYYMRFYYYLFFSIALIFIKELLFKIILNDRFYTVYLENESLMKGGDKIFIFYSIMNIILLIFVLYNKNKEMKGLCKISFFALILWVLFGSGIAIRLSLYNIIFLVFLIPLVLKSYSKIRLLFGFIFIIYFFLILYVSSQNEIKSPFLPYKNVFFNSGESFK